uniref:Uncharacterized protein n=1 Tax=Acrobeloides nanus TaxID=290746 RepID=A0A914D8H5_9BILA
MDVFKLLFLELFLFSANAAPLAERLFMLSMDHIPTGPYYSNVTGNVTGWHSSPIWPAWWMNGDDRSNGEFDMFEAYEPNNHASITLHDWDQSLYGNCTMPDNITQYANSSGNAFGGITQFSPNGTSLEPFNKAGGGVYVMQWDHGKFIREWTFVKPNIPADILNGSPNPNPDTWGMPNAYFPFGKNCHPDTVNHMYLILNIAFCNGPVTEECKDIVRMQPEAFNETYFLINYMKAFCRPNEKCLTGIYGSG